MIDPQRILAVCGFPRSGTTLTMRLLHAAGVPVVADNLLSFECERASVTTPHRLRDGEWWESCRGKAVKLLEPQHLNLPRGLPLQLVWCQRDPLQQAKSQLKILRFWCGLKASSGDLSRMVKGLRQDTPRVQAALQEAYPEARFLICFFEDTLKEPGLMSTHLCRWAGLDPAPERVAAMVRQVLPRGAGCLPYLLEETLEKRLN